MIIEWMYSMNLCHFKNVKFMNKLIVFLTIIRVPTGHGKSGKLWNLKACIPDIESQGI